MALEMEILLGVCANLAISIFNEDVLKYLFIKVVFFVKFYFRV